MLSRRWSLTIWALAAAIAARQLDPIRNMCWRFFHQSVVKNSTLYISGGIETFIGLFNGSQSGNKTQGYNDPRIYLYGGYTSHWNATFPDFQWPALSQYVLWSYDTTSGRWDQYDISAASPWRPSSGAHTEAPDQGLAFYFNGEINSGSSQTTQVLGDNVKIFLDGLIVINTTDHTATNLSTSAVSGTQPRTRGSMEYVPGLGSNGILVYVGVSYKSIDELDSEETPNYIPMDYVDIFDLGHLYDHGNDSTGGWYKQKATGDIPPKRAEFCSVLASALDNSSHNIYVHGGRGPNNKFYDDIYVLSLPSFIWTSVYSGTGSRFGHTCHLVGQRQMLTVGGLLSWDVNSYCD
ncbi:hypothetical protein LTR50_006890 [Elasticomyces elasticus]|nr:hypothetical protein LTR50_006890 [Elasticomyces elasticus]